MDKRVSTDVDYLADRLKPLLDGTPVAIQLFNGARNSRKKDPIVAITPGRLFGWTKNYFLVSIVNNGSCVIRFETTRERHKREKQGSPFKPNLTDLIFAGVPAKLASLLMRTLATLIESHKEKKHGTSTTTQRSSTKPQERRTGTKPRTYTQYRESPRP